MGICPVCWTPLASAPEHSADSRGIGFEPERAPTLRAGVVPAAIALESHPIDSRIKIADDGTVQTLTSRMGTGGMNVPLGDEDPLRLRGRRERAAHPGGQSPLRWVLQQRPGPLRACGLWHPSDQSKAMLSSNPHAGIYKARTSRTLDTSGGNPGCNQGGIAVVYAMTTGSYAQVEETSPTLMARDYKDPTAVNSGYTVRRLTPTECARLQGFPDWWCAGLETPEPTREDIAFWTEVWETHRRAVNPSVKPKTERQIVKWLKAPYSDAAEYKMWGNGVALPCVWFVLSGIVFSTQLSPA
ncbi:MAG: DNA cytosine methyltransferase [Dysosmobacter sp.]